MKNLFILNQLILVASLLVMGLNLSAQTISNFENFSIPNESFLNGSSQSGGFSSGNVFLTNNYDAPSQSWQGWAISNTTNTQTPGFNNQYSAITGGGFQDSQNYAVSYAFQESIIHLQNEAAGKTVVGMFLTNSTYAYLSILDGDNFAKRFGGVTGSDPDYFLLTIRKYLDGSLSNESVDFYLADYRFSDNSADYIIDEWTYVDLTSLGKADSLSFVLTSSDTGQFGMNTPAYFCVDNITTGDGTVSLQAVDDQLDNKIYPNPVSNELFLDIPNNLSTEYAIYNQVGTLFLTGNIRGNASINVSDLTAGIYFIQLKNDYSKEVLKFMVR